jgi:hypothetical protein
MAKAIKNKDSAAARKEMRKHLQDMAAFAPRQHALAED